MSYVRSLTWSSGCPVPWSGIIYAILKVGTMGNIHVNVLSIWTSGSGGRCGLKKTFTDTRCTTDEDSAQVSPPPPPPKKKPKKRRTKNCPQRLSAALSRIRENQLDTCMLCKSKIASFTLCLRGNISYKFVAC